MDNVQYHLIKKKGDISLIINKVGKAIKYPKGLSKVFKSIFLISFRNFKIVDI